VLDGDAFFEDDCFFGEEVSFDEGQEVFFERGRVDVLFELGIGESSLVGVEGRDKGTLRVCESSGGDVVREEGEFF